MDLPPICPHTGISSPHHSDEPPNRHPHRRPRHTDSERRANMQRQMEREGILTATLRPDGKRDQWSIFPDKIRKRDRLAAALFG